MPRALAIETSSHIGSVATVLDDRVLAEEQFPHGLAHAAQILPIIDRLTRAQSWSPRDLEILYLSIGPGSFTGLRIAVTLAKTLALATGVKIVAVPTIAVLIQNAPPEAQHVVIVLDAKRGHIYTARFQRVSGQWIVREPAHLDALTEMISRAPRPLHLLGEGIPYHKQFVPIDPAITITAEELWRPRVAAVAQIGFAMAQRNDFADPDHLTPTYIRRPEAEEKWDTLHGS